MNARDLLFSRDVACIENSPLLCFLLLLPLNLPDLSNSVQLRTPVFSSIMQEPLLRFQFVMIDKFIFVHPLCHHSIDFTN